MLSQTIFHAEESNSFSGLRINQTTPNIFHLMFADDLLVFGIAIISNALGVKNFMSSYELFSGQRINYDKSSVYVSPKLVGTMK